jgi:hypothetical protein
MVSRMNIMIATSRLPSTEEMASESADSRANPMSGHLSSQNDHTK